ncbi:hypothetical protein BY458DRAFT_587363 [Sporodiniella umbellata]|nr:hypothetical protein BY458DRAFT_587363 [Sporodiniella umbellata]
MFVFYNVVWIVCVVLLFVSIFMLLRRRRLLAAQNNEVPHSTTMNYQPGAHVIDMHRQTYVPPPNAQPVYRPPETNVEPPPPSYQDYSKDQRLNT